MLQMREIFMNQPKIISTGIRDLQCGDNVRIVQPCNIYSCTLGEDVFVGPYVEIQKGVKIGDRTRIQSHSFICELVTIGMDCVIAHGVMFTNDLFRIGGPARGNQELWKSTLIGNNVSIGSNATILPVKICEHVVIGAGSVVTKSIQEPGIYAGNPACKIREIEIK